MAPKGYGELLCVWVKSISPHTQRTLQICWVHEVSRHTAQRSRAVYGLCVVRLSNGELHNTDPRTSCVHLWRYAHQTWTSSDGPWSPVPPRPCSFVSVSGEDGHESSGFQSSLDSCLTPREQTEEILKTKSQDRGSEGRTQVQDRVSRRMSGEDKTS